MKIEEVTMTPALAQSYLAKNTHNRPMNKSHVKFLSREMEAGRWKLNGDTICVNGTRLLDGQHRLQAIVESGATVRVIVVTGLPNDIFDTKDCGKRRGAADTLAIRGEKNYALLASAIVFVDRYMTGQIDTKQRKYSPSEIEELLEKYGDGLRRSVNYCAKIGTKRLIQPSVLCGLHYIFSRLDESAADDFVKSLIGGHDLDEKSPVFVLRERLMANMLSKAKLRPVYLAALCVKAWNHVRSGSTVRYLRWSEHGKTLQDFPMAQ